MHHKILYPQTPLPQYTDIHVTWQPVQPVEYINLEVMITQPATAFTAAQRDNIYRVKQEVMIKLEEFTLTVGKLGPKTHSSCFFLTGGAIGSLLRGEKPNDWDIYFRTEADAKAVFDLYEKDPAYQNQVAVLDEKYRETADNSGMIITENATTLKNGLQLIRKHYGEPAQIRKTFDFMHCLPYYDSLDNKIYISPEQYDLNISKKLKHNNNPFQSHREDKFLKRGWIWQQ